MPYLNTPNGRIFFHVQGNGPPLVLIHGAWASHEWWKEQIKGLSASYRVYAMDLRGHGLSCNLEGPSSIEEFSRDLQSLILSENIERPVLVGWSMGGFIAMRYFMDHQKSRGALALIGARATRSARVKARIMYRYFKNLLTLLTIFSEPRNYKASDIQGPGPANPLLRREVKRSLSENASEELVDWIAGQMGKTLFRNYLEIARSFWNWGPGERIRAIRVPTLVMVGENDNVTPPENSQFIHEHIEGSTLSVIPDAGHYCALERPGMVNERIKRFLNDQ